MTSFFKKKKAKKKTKSPPSLLFILHSLVELMTVFHFA